MYKLMIEVLNNVKYKVPEDNEDHIIADHLIQKYALIYNQIMIREQSKLKRESSNAESKQNIEEYHVDKLKIKSNKVSKVTPELTKIEDDISTTISSKYLLGVYYKC